MATQHATRSHARLANNQTCRNALLFFSAKSTCCVKLHKTAENVGAKSEKCLCEQLRCPKHAERGKSTRRFKSRFRLSLRNKQKLTSLRWIGWLRLGMLAQACGARKISKTLQDQSPTDCCGANISSHLFVALGGCDFG